MSEQTPDPDPRRRSNSNGTFVSIARDVVATMKRDPLMLAFMVLMLILFWLIKTSTEDRRKLDHEMMTNILAACLPAIKKE